MEAIKNFTYGPELCDEIQELMSLTGQNVIGYEWTRESGHYRIILTNEKTQFNVIDFIDPELDELFTRNVQRVEFYSDGVWIEYDCFFDEDWFNEIARAYHSQGLNIHISVDNINQIKAEEKYSYSLVHYCLTEV